MIAGRATAEGTRAFAARFAGHAAGAYRTGLGGLTLSALGQGTYLGNHDERTDALYTEATRACLDGGINVLDTAIVYRCMRSERTVGAALRAAVEAGALRREGVVVATKGGYVPFDGAPPANPGAYFRKEYLEPGILRAEEVAGGSHCLAPKFLRDQLARSLANLGLAHVDLYYLHNPESQLEDVDRAVFLSRMKQAFQTLEEEVAAGRVGVYGTATWSGYRVPAGSGEFLDLAELVALAEEVAGRGHHFRAVQLPFNLGMVEAFGLKNQRAGGGELVSPLEAAEKLGLTVICSASILQSQLARGLPAQLAQTMGMSTDAQRAIQFVRSTPGVTTALVGMKSQAHVEENLAVLRAPAAGAAVVRGMFEEVG